MNYQTTDPIGHSLPEPVTKRQRPVNSMDMGANYKAPPPATDSKNWEKRSLSNVSNRARSPSNQDETIAYAQQMQQNEKEFQKEQKNYLNSEYMKQKREQEMKQRFEQENKMQEYAKMKAEESHRKNMEIMMRKNELASQRNLMDENTQAIRLKQQMLDVEREIERKQAQTLEATARNSLYNDNSKRKEMLDRYKTDFKSDYNNRLKAKENQKIDKVHEQEEYRKLLEQNSQREIANERAYKKRFEDFDKNLQQKTQKFYSIVNENDWKRNKDVLKITEVDKLSFYDYYNNREKDKIKKAEEMKNNSYKSMKDTIDRNHKNINEYNRQRREEAKRSAEELQKYHQEQRRLKESEKQMQGQYRSILETQVKMKNNSGKFGSLSVNGPVSEANAPAGENRGQMFMIPGINSVSPYVKNQRKGKVALGEHYLKMKNYIDHDQSNQTVNTSLTAHPSTHRLRDSNASKSAISPKMGSPEKPGMQSHRELASTQEKPKRNILAHQGQNSIINPITQLDNPTSIHNVGVAGNKSMTEYLYRRAQNTGIQPAIKRTHQL